MKSSHNKQKPDLTLYDMTTLQYKDYNVRPDFFKSTALKDPLPQENDLSCEKEYYGICLIKATDNMKHSIFGFSELIAGLALLGVIYAIADISYKFRLTVGWRFPLSIKKIVTTFAIIMLCTDVWFSKGWLLPNFLSSPTLLQGLFGICFIILVYNVHNIVSLPSRFCIKNSKIYFSELKKIIDRGNEKELPFIADELLHSAESLIKLSNENLLENDNISNAILRRIADKKLCKHIITSAPDTAKRFFETMFEQKKYPASIGEFTKNISLVALTNEDSRLYYEDSFSSGSQSIDKPFSNAIYGNIDLFKKLCTSPLTTLGILKHKQLDMYTKVLLITIESFLGQKPDTLSKQVIIAALKVISYPCNFLYMLNNVDFKNVDPGIKAEDLYRQFYISLEFVKKVVDYVSQVETIQKEAESQLYECLVTYIIKIITATANVQWSPNVINDIYEMINDNFLMQIRDIRESEKIKKEISGRINKLLHTKLYEKLFDLKGNINDTALLRLFFNIYGINIYGYNNEEQKKFHKALVNWLKKNYLRLRSNSPEEAKSLLVPGRSRYDERKSMIFYVVKYRPQEDSLELIT